MREFISSENQKIKQDVSWRELNALEQSNARAIVSEGRSYLNFSSNDYLGYSTDPRVIAAAQGALAKYGAGGRSSRLVSGTLELHQELEQKLAKFKGTESALLFPTGFMANLSVISALLGPGDAVILDRLCHASLIDGAVLSRARIFVYDHASPESLEKVLRRTKTYAKRLVITESVFSMDGDFAPLPELSRLCQDHGVWLMVDDAHAVGVFGKNGSGMAEHFGLNGKIEIAVGTCSKSLGSQGGFVCGSKDFIDFLVNRARPLIYTTALAPASVAASLKSLELIQSEPKRRERLLRMSGNLNQFLRQNFNQPASNSQIVPYLVGSNENSVQISRQLKELGIFAPAIRPPTVPKNESRLRFSLTSAHQAEDIDSLQRVLLKVASDKEAPAVR